MKSTRKSLSSISVALLGSTNDDEDDDDVDEVDEDDEDKLAEFLLWRFDPLFLFWSRFSLVAFRFSSMWLWSTSSSLIISSHGSPQLVPSSIRLLSQCSVNNFFWAGDHFDGGDWTVATHTPELRPVFVSIALGPC